MKKTERVVRVTAKASGENATSGRIIVNTKGVHKSIPAVVFSAEKANRLLEYMEKANTTANRVDGW